MKKIPIYDLSLGKEELQNVIDAVKSSWIGAGGGKYLPAFEKKFAAYHGVKFAVSAANGTVALHLALKTVGIGPGDEVIVPDMTFAATANAVIHCGATPILSEIHPEYWNIDPDKIETKITKKTKVIIPVHLYGHPCEMKPILQLAKKHHLFVIEDCAQANGAEYRGKKVGSFGDINCFSFHASKIITTGEGGMCLTNNQKWAQQMEILKNHGMNPKKRYWHEIAGFNYRMTNLQAAIGSAQFKRIDKVIQKKRQMAKWYCRGLANLALDGLITLPQEMPWAKSVYWMFSILIEKKARINRNEFIKRLAQNGVEGRPFYYALHLMPPYKEDNRKFPITEIISKKGVNLPSSIYLTKKDINKICSVVKRCFQTAK